MNKEEIEKAIKALICSQCGKCYFPKRRNCRACLEKNRRMIKEYIQQLENKASILDKVTDKLKEIIKKERELMPYLPHKSASFHYSNSREVLAKEILNIIEQKQYCCNCGVELNSENKALDNMCNECKYGLEY